MKKKIKTQKQKKTLNLMTQIEKRERQSGTAKLTEYQDHGSL